MSNKLTVIEQKDNLL